MPEKKKKYLTRDQRDNRTAWIMLAPALLFLAVMIAYPLGKVIHDAFSQVNLIKPNVSGFAGLDNFKTILNDEHFWNDAKNTVIWTVCSVAGEYIVGMLAAVLLNQKFKGRAIFRTCVFIPWLVPIIVAGMTWDWMLNTDFGIVNYLLTHLHIVQAPINFLGDARFAMATVIFVNIWRSFPYYTISFLAAMQSIPGDLSEAAAIDGAGMFTRFFRITLPMISPMIVYLVITGFIGAFKAYSDAVALFGTDLNAAGMNTIVGYVYDMLYGDSGGYPSYASAAAIILFVIVLTITCINLLVIRKRATD